MRVWLGLLGLVALTMFVATAVSPARVSSVAPQGAHAKTCHTGYVLASFPWGERCIRSGQYCKKVRNPEYHRYNFQCVNGKLRKQRGKGNS